MSSMGGPVALNQLAIHAAMDVYSIEFRQDCFDKVVKLGRYFVRKIHDEAELKRRDK